MDLGISSIQDTIYTSQLFDVSALLMLDSGNKGGDVKYNFNSINLYSRNGANPSIYINTAYGRLITFKCKHRDITSGRNINGESIAFKSSSFSDIITVMRICTEWLRSDRYKYLYKYDTDGNLIGLGSPPPYNPCVHKDHETYIRFSPSVVTDEAGIMYDGIRLASNRAPMASLTCTEFLSLSHSLETFLSNSTGNFNTLLNTALLLRRDADICKKNKLTPIV